MTHDTQPKLPPPALHHRITSIRPGSLSQYLTYDLRTAGFEVKNGNR